MAKTRQIDVKYHIEVGPNNEPLILNTESGEVLPEDEPLMLFRAKDSIASELIFDYGVKCRRAGCSDRQLQGVDDRLKLFQQFAVDHPKKMKRPD